MNQRIQQFAEQCRFEIQGINCEVLGQGFDEEKFAALVAAAEREACAELCEGTHQEYEAYTGQPKAFNYTCAAAIRARGETK